ncbi:MAG: hypothetical protein ABII76_00515 [Pseudomonadota bacterium]
MAKVYIYVVDRDFGFAPNPFHGTCTLATCKPRIRSVAKPGDWIVGVGGTALRATGRCIYFMQVTGSLSFNEYWSHPDFQCKRPARNGARLAMLGDNIYHRENEEGTWAQENSHHSDEDGTPDWSNVANDTGTDRILFSKKFVYFGRDPIQIPQSILNEIGYKNIRNHRTFLDWRCAPLLEWMEAEGKGNWNLVLADPYQFESSAARYSKRTNKIS